MTAPTQAQIEAACAAYDKVDESPFSKTALIAALTAAAQVGEPPKGYVKQETHNFAVRYAANMEATTIERCAQVVDALSIKAKASHAAYLILCEAAAAIRELKA